jgi:prolyl oligopeptidase
MNLKRLLCYAILTTASAVALASDTVDPYLWLEDVTGERALNWVNERNAIASKELEAQPGFADLQARLLSIYESNQRIPYVGKQGRYFYNFWRDANNVRGVWRRTTLEEYRKSMPAWEIVLDVDALAASENENWVWGGANCVRPTYDRCLVSFSRGGGDARAIREFDVEQKRFVADGFTLPESKGSATWINRDELYVARDFGPDTLTASGYPRIVKRWRRGTPLSAAGTVYEGKKSDVSVGAYVDEQPGFRREFVLRNIAFYRTEYFLVDGKRLRKLPIPPDAELDSFRDFMLLSLRTDWRAYQRRYPGGALLAIPWRKFLSGDRRFQTLYAPTPRSSLGRVRPTLNHLLVGELDNVQSRIHAYRHEDGEWKRDSLPIPSLGTVGASPIDAFESDEYFLTVSNFVTPSSLYLGNVGNEQRELLKQLPAFFDASDLQVTQHEAVSKDGTRVPYFQVAKRDTPLDGTTPTLLYGYGGFEISYQPNYSAAVGSAWLERGGAYVLANIRGGGEFGPRWHQAALKENRQRSFDDFIAVAEDLITRKITSPKHLGIMGGSNGGLLMGVMLTQRPDLFGAIVCQVPLLDMRRYHLLLAGASWMAEYGTPDKPSEWAYIGRYSPYQNLQADKQYPRVLFTTSTRDDRVHPGHARKMAAKMAEYGHDFLYYENTEGGHGGAANNKQQAYMNALAYAFLWKELAP